MKLFSTMIVSTLVLSSVGCSQGEAQESQSTQTTTESEATTEPVEKTEAETKSEEQSEETPTFPALPTDTTATIKFAHAKLNEDVDAVIAAFNEVYPNITIEREECGRASWDQNDFLMTKAASGALPDVYVGFPSLPLVVSQGWAYPLNDIVKSDSDYEHVSPHVARALTMGEDDTLYATPYEMNVDIIGMNMDLLEELNLDAPEFDWTIDEFVELAKAATTNETSGLKALDKVENKFIGVLGGENDLGYFGYNEDLGQVNLTDGTWAKSVGYVQSLTSIKGLVADSLKDKAKTDAGQMDDYQKKFGKDADPMEENKVLMGIWGTWDWGWVKSSAVDWEMYPMPRDPEGKSRQGLHVNYGFMSSTVENPEVAMEFLKFFTYGIEGNKARIEIHQNNVYEEGDEEGELERTFTIPTNTHPDVVSAFAEMDYIPEGVRWIYENLTTDEFDIYRGDWERDIPGISEAEKEYFNPAKKQVSKGETTVEAIAQDTQDKMNELLSQALEDFEAQRAEAYPQK